MALGACSSAGLRAASTSLPKELGSLSREGDRSTIGVQPHCCDGLGTVAQLHIDWSCLSRGRLTMPVLGGVASPRNLHVHHVPDGDHCGNLGVHLRIVLERIHGEADPFIANCPHDHVLPGIRDVSNGDLQDNLGGVGQKCLHSHELAKFAIALAPLQGALRVAQVVGIKELHHIVLDLLEVPQVLLHLGSSSTLGGFHHQGHFHPDAVELSHCPAVAIDMKKCRERPGLSLAGPMANIIFWSPKATNHCGRIRAETLANLSLQVLLRVDAGLKLPCGHVRWMGSPVEGCKLLQLHPLGPSRGFEFSPCQSPYSTKLPQLAPVQVAQAGQQSQLELRVGVVDHHPVNLDLLGGGARQFAEKTWCCPP